MTELLPRKATVAVQVLPTKASFAPTDPVEVDIRGIDRAAPVTLWHLDRLVAEVTGDTRLRPPVLAAAPRTGPRVSQTPDR